MLFNKERKQEIEDSRVKLSKTLPSLPPIPEDSVSQLYRKKDKVDWLKICFIFIFIIAIFFVFGYHCPIYYWTHIHCPGCGMTRAAISLIQGDWSTSLSFHALLVPTIGLAILYTIVNKKNPHIGSFLLWMWIGMMLFYWIYRLLFVFPNVSW